MSKSPAALVEEWFERVWNQNDETTVPQMMAPDREIFWQRTQAETITSTLKHNLGGLPAYQHLPWTGM